MVASWLQGFLTSGVREIILGIEMTVTDSHNESTTALLNVTLIGPVPVSCKQQLEFDSSSQDGVYTIKPLDGIFVDAVCDMTTNGGGWTMVAKVSNDDDGKPFTNKGAGASNTNPLATGASVGSAAGMLDRTANADGLGEQFLTVSGTDLMVFDEKNDAWVKSTLGATPETLFQRLLDIPLGASVPLARPSCALTGTNVEQSGNKVADIPVEGLGLKCQDDDDTVWRCDDDAVWIGWGSESKWHREGIAKCGSDGGKDIYNKHNSNSGDPGFVSVWVR